jgi:peptidoglycan hydrolase CwlO-like protein
MKFGIKKMVLLFLVTILLCFSAGIVSSRAQDATPTLTPTPAPVDNSGAIQDLQNKINAAKAKKQTYSSQIELIGNQIKLTEYRIEATQEQITSVTLDIDTTSKKISGLQSTLDNSIRVLLNRIVATYEVGTIQPFQILLTSNNASDFFSRLNYLKLAQAHDKQLIYDTQQAKVDYSNQKTIFEDKKKQLASLQQQLQVQTDQLNQEKQVQQQLLATTEVQIAQYQAQLSALQNFARSRVGSGGGIISHQDLSDDWGKYYNQRDANWGNSLIGLSNEQVWEVGCLMTSYAMVATHYGGSITPADVAANTGNFSGGSAFFNAPGPSANGHSANYVTNPSLQSLKDALNSGQSVIVGLSADGGPFPTHYSDHWVVLRSVDGDSFKINDPFYAGAMNVSLNDHYSGWTIIEARIYN